MVLAQPPPPPPQPQQPRMQPVRQAPPPPTQQPQYQQPQYRQPAPTRTAPVQPVAQQPQAQPTYYKTLPPSVAASTAPPKKSRKGPIIGVVIVVAILLIAVLAYLFMFGPDEGDNGEIPTVTYQELMDDIEVEIGTTTLNFKSYDDGDVLNVVGTVKNVRTANVPTGTFGIQSGPWTIIYFEEPSGLTAELYNGFAYKGDLRSEYTIGEEGTITVHIEKMSFQGISAEYPDEAMTTSMIEEYMDVPNVTLVFTENTPGNYTGSITSSSDIVPLSYLEIEIYDASEGSTGSDDWDLTDDNPEVIETWSGDLLLEYRDVNDNDMLDSVDTFTLYYAEEGDTVELLDPLTYDPDTFEDKTISECTIP